MADVAPMLSDDSFRVIPTGDPFSQRASEKREYEQSVSAALHRRVDDFLAFKFFPTVKDYADYVKFRRYQYARFDVYSALITTLLYFMAFVTRANLPGVPTYSPCFAAAFALTLVTLVLTSSILTASIIMYVGRPQLDQDHGYAWLVLLCRDLLGSRMRWLAEECLPVLTALSTGLYLLARVLAGPCPPGTSIWLSQACNPVANRYVLMTKPVPFIA